MSANKMFYCHTVILEMKTDVIIRKWRWETAAYIVRQI